jgi:hypothetical protein
MVPAFSSPVPLWERVPEGQVRGRPSHLSFHYFPSTSRPFSSR